MLDLRRRVTHFHIGKGMRAAFWPDQQGIALGIVAAPSAREPTRTKPR